MSIFVPPKLKLSYGECNTLLDLLKPEMDKLGEVQRTGVGLEAIAANSEAVKLRELYNRIYQLRDRLAGW